MNEPFARHGYDLCRRRITFVQKMCRPFRCDDIGMPDVLGKALNVPRVG